MKKNKNIVRDAFVFYRSFKDAMDEIDDVTKLSVYEAITYYALDGVELNLKGCAKALFTLIKPQIDANNRKWENGCKGGEHGHKGGAPKGNKNAQKQPQNNPKTTPNEKDKDNDNDNDKDKENEKDFFLEKKSNEELYFDERIAAYTNVQSMDEPLTFKDWEDIKKRYGVNLSLIKLAQLDNIQNLKQKYKSAYRTLDKWCTDAKAKEY